MSNGGSGDDDNIPPNLDVAAVEDSNTVIVAAVAIIVSVKTSLDILLIEKKLDII